MADQFYTNEKCARKYYELFTEHVNVDNYDVILEPSAGTGSFFNLIPFEKRIGLDIEPKCEGVLKQDFLKFNPNVSAKYAVIGNPPFGRVSSLAIKFFNKSAEFADVIAFILPRTFKRVSVQNRLDLNFHILYQEDLPLVPCCFSPKMSAKCVFQIWEKRSEKRRKVVYSKTTSDFQFIGLGSKDRKGQPTPPKNADFALKAYGSGCGEIVDGVVEMNSLRPKSWHFIRANIDVEELKRRFRSLDYSLSEDTVRQNSIGRQELIYIYECQYG
jgi:hypothetical protein